MNTALESLGVTKDALVNRIVESFLDRHEGQLLAIVERKVEEAISKEASAKIASALDTLFLNGLSHQFQPVNHWGEAVGEKTSIRDHLMKETKEWWTTKVDPQGRPNSFAGTTRAQYFATKLLKEVFQKEMLQQVDQITQDAKAQLAEGLSKLLKERVDRALKLR